MNILNKGLRIMCYDVLLINPTHVGIDSYITPPIHLMYLAKALAEAGHTYKIINVHEIFCRKAHALQNDNKSLKAHMGSRA